MADPFRLDGRTALVTGSRRGIGQAVAAALAAAGADVIGVSQQDEGPETAKLVLSHGRRYRGYACDLGSRPALADLLARLRAEHPPLDVLVNNAGIILRREAAEHPDEYWDRVLEVNLSAPFVLAREVGRDMLARGRGKIVFTASLLSFQGGVFVPSYAASKGGIAQLTKALANEWAGKGVNVNAVAPGYVATDNTAALRNDPDRNRAILERIPAGRWGRPEDVAGAVVFLCSPAADYVHGQVLAVDGGWLGR